MARCRAEGGAPDAPAGTTRARFWSHSNARRETTFTPDALPEKPLRLFVAVAVPDAVKEAVATAVARLRGSSNVRWVAPENLHLTLKFLGETPANRVPDIDAALRKTANDFSRFVVELSGFGVLPNARMPRTICLWAGGDSNPLPELADAVDRAVHPFGCAREKRRYRGHLTIGRVKSPAGLDRLIEVGRAWQDETPPVPWPVGEIHLIRSELQPAGPIYTVLGCYPLKDTTFLGED